MVEYTEVERAYLKAADGKFTVAEVAEKLGREEMAVYMMARRMDVKFKPKPMGTLLLNDRGTSQVKLRKSERAEAQRIIQRIGEAFGLTSKSDVWRKALGLADLWLDDHEEGGHV